MKLSNAYRRLLSVAVAALFIVSAGSPLAAQTTGNGNIIGTITDQSSAIVPNANVVVRNTDTGVSRTITTNSDGSYTANFLLPGPYEVSAGGSGFGKVD